MMRYCVIRIYCFLFPFALAFRIVAWQALYHGERVTKLGPRYHCATCVLPEKDLPRACPACALTDTFEFFKQRVIIEAHKRYGVPGSDVEWPFEFSVTDVLDAYSGTRRLLDDNDEKIKPEWDYVLASLSRIILSERNQYQAGKLFKD
jgi:hypothetical protein